MKLVVGGTITSSFIMTYATLVGMGIGALIAVSPVGKIKLSFHTLVNASGIYTLISAFCVSPLLQQASYLLVKYSIDPSISSTILYVVATLALLPAAILSGATVPRIIRFSTQNSSLHAETLYGVYTLGSGIGIYALVRIFLPLFNFLTNFIVIASTYFAISIMLFAVKHLGKNQRQDDNIKLNTITPLSKLAFIQGISSAMIIILEVSIFRSLSVKWGSDSAYAFPFALITYLIGYAAGSILLTSFYKRFIKLYGLLPILLLLPVAFVATVYIPKTIPNQGLISLFFLGGFQHTALVAFVAGAIFPLILYTQPSETLEQRSGIFSFISSIGTFIGGILLMSIGLPYFGTQASITASFIIYLIVINFLLAEKHNRIISGIVSSAILILIVCIPKTIWMNWVQGNTSPYAQAVEGSGGVARIDWNSAQHTSGTVVINGTPAAYLPYIKDHTLLAALASGVPNRNHVLLLGLGGGGLTRDILKLTQVKTVDVVEWSREVITLLHTPQVNNLLENTLGDERVTIYPTDARTYMTTAFKQDKKYSLIIDNLTVLGWSGSTALRSIEYFRAMMPILANDGVYIIFMHHNTNMQYQSALAGLSVICPNLASYDKKYVVCSKQTINWDIAYMDSILELYSAKPQLQQTLIPQSQWLFEKYIQIEPESYTNMEPIYDSMPYFEYEPFAIRKK